MMIPLFTSRKNFVLGAKLGSFRVSNLEVMIPEPETKTNNRMSDLLVQLLEGSETSMRFCPA